MTSEEDKKLSITCGFLKDIDCSCDVPKNIYSPSHEHEPEIPPAYDKEGRCLICVMITEQRNLKTIAYHLGEDNKELRTRLTVAIAAEKEGWNRFYALRSQVGEEKYPGMIRLVRTNEGVKDE